MLSSEDFIIQTASEAHCDYALEICQEIETSAKLRGTGIAKRDPEYVKQKIRDGKAIIALRKADGHFAGFCYIETWGHERFVANSGLIVNPEFRKYGLATLIKESAFALSRHKYPEAKIFGLTTSLPVMKINSDLGYKPVTFSELTDDDQFWKGCQSCVNYDVLTRTNRKLCLCTGMLYDPQWEKEKPSVENNDNNGKETDHAPSQDKGKSVKIKRTWKKKWQVYERWMRIRANVLLRGRATENADSRSKESVLTSCIALFVVFFR